VQAVDVLVGVHLEQRGLEVDLLRRRVLHQHRVDRGVVVHRPDRGDDVGLRGVLGQVQVRAGEAERVSPVHLHPDVAGAGRVAADQDGAEARAVAAGDERRDARGQVVEDRLRHGGTGQHQGHGRATYRVGGLR
jgi:hypothetical protein